MAGIFKEKHDLK